MEKASATIGCDPSMIALPLLSAIAGAIGNTRRIRLRGGWDEPCVVWTAIVSPSGTLKSPAIEAAVKPLLVRQAKAMRRFDEELRTYDSDLREHKADFADWQRSGRKRGNPQPDEPLRPVCERILVNDITIEALVKRLADNPRGLLLYRDELAGWLGSFDAYKSGKGSDAAHWLSMHGARDVIVDRRNGDTPTIYAARAAVSVCGGIQPEILSAGLGREHFQDGLAARLLLAMPPRRAKRWSDEELTEADLAPMDDLFARLLALEPAVDDDGNSFPRTVPLTSHGKDAWIAFYEQHSKEQVDLTGDLAAAWSKLEGYAARLALIIHVVRTAAGDESLRHPDAVDDASIAAAVELVRWFGHEARRVYGVLVESDDERAERELIELIERKGGRITARDLYRSGRRYQPTAVAEAALNQLAQAGLGQWRTTETAGAPKREFVLG